MNYRMKAEGGHIGARMMGQPTLAAELHIKVMSDGTIQITGPLTEKQVCIDILNAAKEQIENADVNQLVSSN